VLDSVAKPLGEWALVHESTITSSYVQQAIESVLNTLEMCNSRLIDAFSTEKRDDNSLFPLSRIANITAGAFSPLLARLLVSNTYRERTIGLIGVIVRAAAISVHRIPELAAASTLGTNLYDIRGAMRGPGGEDHVGCLALVRLVYEADEVARLVGSLPGVMVDLCNLHHVLKSAETHRGRQVDHGFGVTPKSRRILLNALCHIELKSEGQAGVANALHDLFQTSCRSIGSLSGCSTFAEDDLYAVAENTFDLASFPRAVLSTAFETGDPQLTACLQVLVKGCISGYESLSFDTLPDAKLVQVSRRDHATVLMFAPAND
jgi:hypothetical protein